MYISTGNNSNDFINDENTYNQIWQSDHFVNSYLDKQRTSFYEYVIKTLSVRLVFTAKKDVIDVGCGTGDFLRILGDSYPDLIMSGLDYSSASIERCKNAMPNSKFYIGNIFDLSGIQDTFDVVFCMGVIEHIEFPEKAVENLKHITKKDGLIIITIPNGEIDNWIGHINFWSRLEFSSFLSNANLTLIDSSIFEEYYMIFICKN